MDIFKAISESYRLHEKWVSSIQLYTDRTGRPCPDLERVHASMLHESRWHLNPACKASDGLKKETRGELILLGKIRKALGEVRQ